MSHRYDFSLQGFSYRSGELYVGSQSVAQIAHQVSTPCYIYSANAIAHNVDKLKNALNNSAHEINFAVKANPNIAILALLNSLGCGFDVVSLGEMKRALAAGAKAEKICFSGVGKSVDEIEYAIKNNIASINIESSSEFNRVAMIAKSIGKTVNIGIRINPDVDAKTHEYISTGLNENKFGVNLDTALKLYEKSEKLPYIKANGVAFHIGSQITTLDPLVHATEKVLQFIDKITESGIKINHLDLGGGLGIRYRDENPPSLDNYVRTLLSCVDKNHAHLDIAIEPGRSIVGNAGILVTKIEYIKRSDSKNFAIVDAAMNDLIRPALYNAWMNITEVNKNNNTEQSVYDIVGPVCESTDFLGKMRHLQVCENDLLAVHGCGAYTMSMSSNYNSRRKACEILVEDDKYHVIRKRETYQDLWNLESIPEIYK